MTDSALPKRLRREQKQDGDGQCLHVNRVCVDTRNTCGPFLKRRVYRCDDCGRSFHTAEVITTVSRWDDDKVTLDIIRRLAGRVTEINRYLNAIKRSAAGVMRVLGDSE